MGAPQLSRAGLHPEPARSTHKSLKTLLLIYMPPWLGWVVLGGATVGAWLLWGEGDLARPLFSMGAVISTASLAGYVSHLARPRGPGIRWLAVASVAVAGLWLIVAVLTSPFTRPVPDIYLGGGVVVCVFWTARRALLSSKGEHGPATGQAAKLLDVLDGARLAKVVAKDTKLGAQIVEAKVEVDRGRQSVADLQGKTGDVETVLGLRPGSVTLTRDPDDAGEGTYRLVPVDMLAKPVESAGPDRPGDSIAVPIRIGPYLDGEDCEIIIPGDSEAHRNLAHVLAQGTTGAGKSEALRNLMTSVLCRTEVTVVASDPVKGLQTLGVFIEADAFDLFALDVSGSRAILAGLRRAIVARGTFLGQRGFKQWQPGCGLNLLVAWFEEANWATQSAALEQAAAECRSVGIWLVVSQQRASHTKTSTDLRPNLSAGWCFGVKDQVDASFNLPDSVIDDGASPWEWGGNRPGYSYLVHPSIPEANWTKILRPELMTDATIRAALTEWAHVRSPMDDVTREAFGAAYDQIKASMAAWVNGVGPTGSANGVLATTGVPATIVVDDEDDDFDMDDEEPDDPQSDDDGMPPLGPTVEPDIEVDPNADVEPPPADLDGFTFGGPKPRQRQTTEARAIVQTHLRALLDDGKSHCTPAEIAAMRPATGRSREWIRQELHRLCTDAEANEITLELDMDAPVGGTFMMRAPALAGAGA